MSVEIERKYLVRRLPDDLDKRDGAAIRQGYVIVSEDDVELRLRHKQEKYYQTIKMGAGLARTEIEIELNRDQFEQMWPHTESRRVDKTRYNISLGDLTAELDVFEGGLSGLTLVEVEFASIKASKAFTPPKWFGPDITEDKRYKNKYLATHGIPDPCD
jgi:adenylate cyclase